MAALVAIEVATKGDGNIEKERSKVRPHISGGLVKWVNYAGLLRVAGLTSPAFPWAAAEVLFRSAGRSLSI